MTACSSSTRNVLLVSPPARSTTFQRRSSNGGGRSCHSPLVSSRAQAMACDCGTLPPGQNRGSNKGATRSALGWTLSRADLGHCQLIPRHYRSWARITTMLGNGVDLSHVGPSVCGETSVFILVVTSSTTTIEFAPSCFSLPLSMLLCNNSNLSVRDGTNALS